MVSVPEGPLVRVEGQPLSLRCNVSEYEGPLEQVFEWQVFQEGKSFQLISFMESSYTDARFAKRVTDGDISLLRLADSAAELRIRVLRASDSGIYTCSTPSTDMSVSGNYQASVPLYGEYKVTRSSEIQLPANIDCCPRQTKLITA